jgi:hypothetical protein
LLLAADLPAHPAHQAEGRAEQPDGGWNGDWRDVGNKCALISSAVYCGSSNGFSISRYSCRRCYSPRLFTCCAIIGSKQVCKTSGIPKLTKRSKSRCIPAASVHIKASAALPPVRWSSPVDVPTTTDPSAETAYAMLSLYDTPGVDSKPRPTSPLPDVHRKASLASGAYPVPATVPNPTTTLPSTDTPRALLSTEPPGRSPKKAYPPASV